jgi:hypothetical protein
MGTNFYTKIIDSKEEKRSLKKTFNSFLKDEISKDALISVINNSNKEIHLGKRSAGWQFLWDHNNGKYYDLTLKDIESFIKDKCLNTVYDEYGDSYSWEKFITEEVSSYLYKDNKHWDGESYNKYILENSLKEYITAGEIEQARRELNSSKEIITIKDKSYEVYCYDFITEEGLRFAHFTEFS